LGAELQKADPVVAPMVAGDEAGDESLNIWIGLRASDHEMFHEFLPLSHVISVDDDPPSRIPCSSLEASTRRRVPWGNDELGTVAGVPSFRSVLNRLARQTRPVNILCYHSLPELEWFAARYPHLRVRAAQFALKCEIDDKFGLPSLLHAAGLPAIPSMVVPSGACDYKSLSRELGSSLVARLRTGASGGGTFLIRNAQDLSSICARYSDQFLTLSPYLPGPSFNVNAFIGNQVHVAPPSVQLVGEEPLGSSPFIYCGNDFSAMAILPESCRRSIMDTTARIGGELMKAGYRGIFGVDLLYHEASNTVYALEINPRFQGSTPALCRYQLSRGQKTLVHAFRSEHSQPAQFEPVNASMMVLHNRSDAPQTVVSHIPSGLYRYRWDDGRFTLTPLPADTIFPSRFDQVLVRSCPQLGTTVSPHAGLLRAEVLGSVLNPATLKLHKKSSRLANALESLVLQKVSACAA